MRGVLRGKRGVYFFVLDVIIAVLIFTVTIIVIMSFNTNRPSIGGTEEVIDIAAIDLMDTPLRDIATSSTLQNLRLNGRDVRLDNTADQLIVELYDEGDLVSAGGLVAEITAWLPTQYGLNYTVDGNEIYSRQAIRSLEDSQVRLSVKKLTVPDANLTTSFSTRVTEVLIWQ